MLEDFGIDVKTLNRQNRPSARIFYQKVLYKYPSSIYSWSIGHILEHEFFCLGHLGCAGSKGEKVDLRKSEQLLRVFFSTFWGQKKNSKFFKNILATALKSYIKWLE